MPARAPVAIAVGCLVCAALAGCGGGPGAPEQAATPSQYIAAVEQLLDPPGQLASTIAERGGSGTEAAPSQTRLDQIVDAARRRLATFRALRLDDPVLQRQRDRLAGAYARMVPRMQKASDALASGDRSRLKTDSRPFLDSLDALSSAAASPASP